MFTPQQPVVKAARMFAECSRSVNECWRIILTISEACSEVSLECGIEIVR
jgi:hypothetical protein